MILTGLTILGGGVLGWGVSKGCDAAYKPLHDSFFDRLKGGKLDPNHDIERAILRAHYKSLRFIVGRLITDAGNPKHDDEITRAEENIRRRVGMFEKDKIDDMAGYLAGDWRTVISASLEPAKDNSSVHAVFAPEHVKMAEKDILALAYWSEDQRGQLAAFVADENKGWTTAFAACIREELKTKGEFRDIYVAHALNAQSDMLQRLLGATMPSLDFTDAMAEVNTALSQLLQGQETLKQGQTDIKDAVDSAKNEIKDELAKLDPAARDNFETAITRIISGSDARDRAATEAIRAGHLEAGLDIRDQRLTQEDAYIDDLNRAHAAKHRDSGAAFYPFNTKKALKAYEKAVKYDGTDVWDYVYLARLYERSGNSQATRDITETALKIVTDDRDKSVLLNTLGDVAVHQGGLTAARKAFEDGLIIAKRLADMDPGHAGFQRDLSISYDRLGDVAVHQGDLTAARKAFEDGLIIAKQLADMDPEHAGFQRDVAVSHAKIAGLGGDNEKENWVQAYQIMKALDTAGKIFPSDQEWLDILKEKTST